MKLSELMAGKTPNALYTGWVTNDDMVFAIDTAPTAETDTTEDNYIVVQMGIEGLDTDLNPVTKDKQYIRAGQSSTKTGTQRTFKVKGDRYIGDAAQDYILSHDMVYAVGNSAVTNYVYFNVLTGKGEKGQVSIIVNSDGGGNSGESAGIDVEFKKIGNEPAEFSWSSVTYPTLTVTSVPLDGATDVSKSSAVVLTFSNAIDEDAVSIFDTTAGNVVAATKSWNTAKKVLTITPSSALSGTTHYLVSIAGVVDTYGQKLATAGVDFTTIA